MEHCVQWSQRFSRTMLVTFFDLFHVSLSLITVLLYCWEGGRGGLLCAICAARMRNVYVCRVRTRCVCEDLCFVFSDWAIASWVLGCAAIYRQNTGLRYTHISRTRSWHFSYFCSRVNAYLATPLLSFLCGYPRRNTFWVLCMWEPTL
jgi:hypothetical protein